VAEAIKNGDDLCPQLIKYSGILPTSELYAQTNWEMVFKVQIAPALFGIFDELPLVPFGNQDYAQIRSGFHGTYVDFLFLPNNAWAITEDTFPRGILVKNSEAVNTVSLEVPGSLLRRAYRKPEMTQELYATPSHYVLSIPPGAVLPSALQDSYLAGAGEKLRAAMVQKKGRGGKETGDVPPDWFNHAYRNGAETSVGQLWAFEKIYPINRSNLSTFSREPVTAPNMFHLIYGPSIETLETLHSWFNTTFFFAEYFLHAKSIRRGWLKGTISTFKILRVPDLTPAGFSSHHQTAAITAIRELAEDLQTNPQPIADQLDLPARLNLDRTWVDILELSSSQQDDLVKEARNFVSEFIKNR
jgi:hypothetical protein